MTRTLRVGVVGGGFGQHVQVPAFRAAPGVTVDAICASTEARARTFAERLGIPRATGDWRELVRDPALDAVAVSVPPSLQAPILLGAIAAGKHVFAEKPLAMNATDARAVLDAARAAGVVGGLDFEFREISAWQRARALLAEGALGRLRHAYLSWRIETLAHREGKLNWKRDAVLGGGALNLFGSHALDSIWWLFGETRVRSAHLLTAAAGTADARVEAVLASGADEIPVSLSIAADAPLGSGHRLEVYGEDGALVLENRGSDYASGFSLALGRRGGALANVELEPFPPGSDGRVVATARVVRRFVQAVATGTPMSPGLEDGLRVQDLIDAIRAADRRPS
ncbi:MAG: Gfo/Idh/MocA family oxidoreductase [Myxococcales bacterium]